MSDRFDNPPPTSARGRAPSARELALRAELIQVRHELKQLLHALEQVHVPPPSPFASAVITAVVPKTQLMYQGDSQADVPRPYMEASRVRALSEPAKAEVSVPIQSKRR